MKRVCVFCGSREGSRPSYAEATRRVGRIGLMGALADAALNEGGEVIGVIPEALLTRELAHPDLTELHVVGTMHERKKLMADLSDGFITLPGGYGTLEEFAEVLSWAQLSIHEKPCALLELDGYWEPLSRLLDRAVAEGFAIPDHRALVLMQQDIHNLLDLMDRYTPPKAKEWIKPQDL